MTDLGPDLPANWYLLGKASALRRGALQEHRIGDRSLVLWRGRDSGIAACFAARCAHMGCHLGRGDVVGDTLRCALHHRMIGADGSFAHAGDHALMQAHYPVVELLGGIWVRLGDAASDHPLADAGLDDLPMVYAGEHAFGLPWQALVANGFDAEHLSSVHERQLLDQPDFEQTGPRSVRLRYRTHPAGAGIADRLTRLMARGGLHGTITGHGGSMMLVESRLGRREALIVMSFLPTPEGGTLIRAIAGLRRPDTLGGRIRARIAAALFKAFLYKDLRVLDGLDWHEPAHAATLGDRFTRQLCAHFRTLPHA